MDKILACIPRNMEEEARQAGMTHTIDPGDGYALKACRECKRDVWMGPRQKMLYDVCPSMFTILCFVCARPYLDTHEIMNCGNENSGRMRKL